MFRLLVWHVLVVTVSCDLYAQESVYTVPYAREYHNYQPRDYHFNYAVSDPHTGDHKQQWEVKEKGVVRGGYSLLEPDGTTRIVEYIADHDGFRAVVNKLGAAVHPEPVHQVVPLSVAHYKTYDGYAGNYANAYANQNFELLSQPQAIGVSHLEQKVVPSQGYDIGIVPEEKVNIPVPELNLAPQVPYQTEINHANLVPIQNENVLKVQGVYGDQVVPQVPIQKTAYQAVPDVIPANLVPLPNHGTYKGVVVPEVPIEKVAYQAVPELNLASLVPPQSHGGYQGGVVAPQVPIEKVAYQAAPDVNLASLVPSQNPGGYKGGVVAPQVPIEKVSYQAVPDVNLANLVPLQSHGGYKGVVAPQVPIEKVAYQAVPEVNLANLVPPQHLNGYGHEGVPQIPYQAVPNANLLPIQNERVAYSQPEVNYGNAGIVQGYGGQTVPEGIKYQPQQEVNLVPVPELEGQVVPDKIQSIQNVGIAQNVQAYAPQSQNDGTPGYLEKGNVQAQLVPVNPSYSTTIDYQTPHINPPQAVKDEDEKFLIRYQ